MQIRIRATGQVLLQHEWEKWVAQTYAKSLSGITEEVVNRFESDIVFEGPQAQPTRYQFAFRDGVAQDEQGRWFTKYSVADMDADAIAAKDAEQAKAIRQQRTEKLKDSDWTQVADAPVDKAVWAAYRQQLRDITAQAGFPWDITWPDAP